MTDEFRERLLTGLNPEQREVVLHDKGPLLVVAVAGAGKTHALVNRCGYLVRVRGVDPSRILAVTFSKAGATEMEDRLKGLIGDSGARIGTFHSLALEIIRTEVPGYKDWKIDDSDRYRFCIKDVTGYREMKWDAADVTLLSAFIGLCKSNVARPESDEARAIADSFYARKPSPASQPSRMLEAYSRAENMRRERLLITFDDMLMEAVELLRDNDGIRARWASKYDYVLQDEAQDQNLGQLLMGELLAKDHRNYMLVGDPAQAIYSWRGAKPEKLLNFRETWDAHVVLMGRNYRCGRTIIDAANASLDAMDPATRLDVKMIAERKHDSGASVIGEVICKSFGNLDDEGFGIVEHIQGIIADGHFSPKDIAVLYRTNAQSRSPEEALISARLPYRVIGGISFYERREVKNLLAYLRLANESGDLDDIARCINTPFRYLGKAFTDKVRAEAERVGAMSGTASNWASIIRTVATQAGIQSRQRHSADQWAGLVEEMRGRISRSRTSTHGSDDHSAGMPARILEDIIRSTGYVQALQKEEGEESPENSRVSNVREMVRAAGRFTSVAGLLDYVDKTVAASKKNSKGNEKNPDKVTLCTLHRAKGLEWPVVFMIGVSDKILPHGMAEEPEEERRLFYVGLTRARDLLHISCVRNVAFGAKVFFVNPSPFLAEAGLVPVESATTAPEAKSEPDGEVENDIDGDFDYGGDDDGEP